MRKNVKNIWKELKARWSSTSPYLFRVIQKIAGVVASISGIFIGLDSAGVKLPEPFNSWGSKTVIVSSVLALIIAKLPVDTKEATKEVLDKIQEKKPE